MKLTAKKNLNVSRRFQIITVALIFLCLQGCATHGMTYAAKAKYKGAMRYEKKLSELNENFDFESLGISTSHELLQRKICNPKYLSNYKPDDKVWDDIPEKINVGKYRKQMVCDQLAADTNLEVRRTLINDDKYGSITTYYLTDGEKVIDFAISRCSISDRNPDTPAHCNLTLEP